MAHVVVYNIIECTEAKTVEMSLCMEADNVYAGGGSRPDYWITWILQFDESGEQTLKCEESMLGDEDRFSLWLS